MKVALSLIKQLLGLTMTVSSKLLKTYLIRALIYQVQREEPLEFSQDLPHIFFHLSVVAQGSRLPIHCGNPAPSHHLLYKPHTTTQWLIETFSR